MNYMRRLRVKSDLNVRVTLHFRHQDFQQLMRYSIKELLLFPYPAESLTFVKNSGEKSSFDVPQFFVTEHGLIVPISDHCCPVISFGDYQCLAFSGPYSV